MKSFFFPRYLIGAAPFSSLIWYEPVQAKFKTSFRRMIKRSFFFYRDRDEDGLRSTKLGILDVI